MMRRRTPYFDHDTIHRLIKAPRDRHGVANTEFYSHFDHLPHGF